MLDFQNIDIPLGKLNTKSEPGALAVGDLTIAQNVTSQVDGSYEKRNGYTALTAGPTNIRRLAGLGATLLALTDVSCYTYNGATGAWFNAGSVDNAQTSQQAIAFDQTKDIIQSTRATAGSVTAHFWIAGPSGGSVFFELRSTVDNSVIASALADNTAGFDIIHSVAVGQFIFAAWVDNTTQVIRGVKVDSTTGSITAAATILSGANVFATGPFLDVAPYSSTECYIAYVTNTPNVKVNRFNVSTFTITITSGNLSAADGITTGTAIAVMGTVGESAYVVYQGGAGNVRATTFDATSLILGSGPLNVFATGNMRNAGLVRYDSTHALVLIDIITAGPIVTTHWAFIDSTAVVTSDTIIPAVGLLSKPWAYGGNYYVNLFASFTGVNPANVGSQYTFFTVRVGIIPQAVVAMHAYRSAYINAISSGQVSDVDTVSTGSFAFNAAVAYKYISTSAPRAAIASFGVNLNPATSGMPIEALGETFFANGVVKHFDGVRPTECNFLLYPVFTSASPGAVGGGGMDNGTYSYIAIYESADANGNVDRSTTSIPVSATTVAGAGLGKVTVTVTQDMMSAVGWSGQQQGNISLFRTKASGTQYFYVGSAVMDPTSATATIVDQANDSTIGSNRFIYTNGGVLDREPPIASMQMVVHKNRAWGISSADRKVLFYSGEITQGEGLWFSSAQQFRVDAGGDIVAIASLDDKLIVFKSDRIFYIAGDCPNQLGQNSTLTAPQLLTTDTGCSDPRSIVTTPNGLMFISAKGYQILTRSLGLVYMAEPDSFATAYPTTVAAVMLPDRREVRWEVVTSANSTGVKTVYNYRDDRWTNFTNVAAAPMVSSVVVGGKYYTTGTGGPVYYENPASWLDAGAFVSMQIRTGFMPIAGKQGLARVKGIIMRGTYYTANDVSLKISAKDYLFAGTVQTATFNDAAQQALAQYPSVQVTLGPQYQQMESIRLEVSDAYSSGTLGVGRGFSFQSWSLLAGAKRGSFEKRMAAGAKA
jgi:hypothetical protein